MFSKLNSLYSSFDADFKSVLHKGAGTFLLRIFGSIIAFIVNVYLARRLNVSGYGLFSLALSIITIVSVFSRFGLDTLALKDISKDKDSKLNGKARSVMSSILYLVVLNSIFFLIVLVLFGNNLSNFIFNKPQLASVLMNISPLLLFFSIGYVLTEGFKAIYYTKTAALIQNVMLPVVFFVTLFFYSFFYSLNPETAALLYSSMSVVILIIFLLFWYSINLKKTNVKYFSGYSLLKRGFPLLLVSAGSLFIAWTDIIILGIFESESNVGIYSAASKVSLVTSLILVSFNAILAPKFSYLYSSNNLEGLKKIAKYSTRLMIFIVLIPSLFFIFFPEIVLGIFGEKFKEGALLLQILSIGQFVNVACGSVGYMLIMTENKKIMSNIMLFAAFFNLLLSLIFVQYLGVFGVALATAISVVTWNVVAVVSVRKYVGFWMF